MAVLHFFLRNNPDFLSCWLWWLPVPSGYDESQVRPAHP